MHQSLVLDKSANMSVYLICIIIFIASTFNQTSVYVMMMQALTWLMKYRPKAFCRFFELRTSAQHQEQQRVMIKDILEMSDITEN